MQQASDNNYDLYILDVAMPKLDGLSLCHQLRTDYLAKRIDQFMIRTNRFVAREKAFSREVSHELRTPLASSRAALDVARTLLVSSDKPLAKCLDRMYRANKDMSHLIETFLLLGREVDNTQVIPEFDLNILVEQAFTKHQYLSRGDAVSCVNGVAKNTLCQTHQQYLSIVLDNLIRNALQHTQSGAVTVSYQEQCISVSDTGDGISEVAASEIQTDVMQKSGIGLTIVRRFCEAQGWVLSIESKVGHGTTVTIALNK